jgi:hypothetical protein
MARVAILLIAALLTRGLDSPRTPDAARVLADMRQALGGKAIDAVETFSVEGSVHRPFRQLTLTSDIEWLCVLPDRFIQVRRVRSQYSDTSGFNGDGLVRLFHSEGRGVRRPALPPPELRTPHARAEIHRTSVLAAKQQFSRFTIAMLGITSVYPLDAAYVIEEKLDGKAVHVLELSAPDGYLSRLYVDTTTHLPRMVSWMGEPDLEHVLVLGTRGSVLPLVEHQMFFSDYKHSAGLNWPHRLKEVVAKRLVADTRLGKFKINPKIDPARFVVDTVGQSVSGRY